MEEQLAVERSRVKEAEARVFASRADDLIDLAEVLDGVQILITRVEADSSDALKPMVDRLREVLGNCFIALAAEIDGRPMFIAAATDDVVERGLHADEVVRAAAMITGGGGGGRPQLAQAGGVDGSRLEEALEVARAAAREQLGG